MKFLLVAVAIAAAASTSVLAAAAADGQASNGGEALGNDHIKDAGVSLDSEVADTDILSGVCPSGFLPVPWSGDQCFKFFPEARMNWTDAKSLCEGNGLRMAKPKDEGTAVALRLILVETYGDKVAWLGGHGNGSHIVWVKDGTVDPTNSCAWQPGYPGTYTTTSYCMSLLSHSYYLTRFPTQPYSIRSCSYHWRYPLCEFETKEVPTTTEPNTTTTTTTTVKTTAVPTTTETTTTTTPVKTTAVPTTTEATTTTTPVKTTADPTTTEATTTTTPVETTAVPTTTEATTTTTPVKTTTVPTTTEATTTTTPVETTAVPTTTAVCPSGFFTVPGSGGQCFKFFPDRRGMNWFDIKSFCEDNGLRMAKPKDEATGVTLRKELILRYGSKATVVGGRGTGIRIKWIGDGTVLPSNSSAWFPYHPGTRISTSYCIALLSTIYYLNKSPTQIYFMTSCSLAYYYPLCEYESTLATTTPVTTTPAVCPSGFFTVPESGGQCFKYFPDSPMNWTAAKSLCEDNGLRIAKPKDEATAVTLRIFIVEEYGDKAPWLGGRGNGKVVGIRHNVVWVRDGTLIPSNSSAWYPGYPNGYSSSTYQCMVLVSTSWQYALYPKQPYQMLACVSDRPYPLCELIEATTTPPPPTTAAITTKPTTKITRK